MVVGGKVVVGGRVVVDVAVVVEGAGDVVVGPGSEEVTAGNGSREDETSPGDVVALPEQAARKTAKNTSLRFRMTLRRIGRLWPAIWVAPAAAHPAFGPSARGGTGGP